MVVKVTGLYTLGDEAIVDEHVIVEYPDSLMLYIIKTIVSVKSSCKFRCSRERKNGVSGMKISPMLK